MAAGGVVPRTSARHGIISLRIGGTHFSPRHWCLDSSLRLPPAPSSSKVLCPPQCRCSLISSSALLHSERRNEARKKQQNDLQKQSTSTPRESPTSQKGKPSPSHPSIDHQKSRTIPGRSPERIQEDADLLLRLASNASNDESLRERISAILQSDTTSKSRLAELQLSAVAKKEEDPTKSQLMTVAFSAGVAFMAFGFIDNFVMIVAGDAVDSYLLRGGISAMAAAGIGNTISDVFGIFSGDRVEAFCKKRLIDEPLLSSAQRQRPRTILYSSIGASLGVSIGCLLGMVPLFFSDDKAIEAARRQGMRYILFDIVRKEVPMLVDADEADLHLIQGSTVPTLVESLMSISVNDNPQKSYAEAEPPRSRLGMFFEKWKGDSAQQRIVNTPMKHLDSSGLGSVLINKRILCLDGEAAAEWKGATPQAVDGDVLSAPVEEALLPLDGDEDDFDSEDGYQWLEEGDIVSPGEPVLHPVLSGSAANSGESGGSVLSHNEAKLSDTPSAAPDSTTVTVTTTTTATSGDVSATSDNRVLPCSSIICCPIFGRDGDVLGALEIRRRGGAPFTSRDAAIVKAICTHLAVSMEGKSMSHTVESATTIRKGLWLCRFQFCPPDDANVPRRAIALAESKGHHYSRMAAAFHNTIGRITDSFATTAEAADET